MNIEYLKQLLRTGTRGQGLIEGIINIAIVITVFAVCYPLLDEMVNLLQANAGDTVDMISAMYLPIMAVVIILSIVTFLKQGTNPNYNYGPQA